MKIAYLTESGRCGHVEVPVSTTYQRICVSYPNREARYCHPGYMGGKDSQKLLGVWQREPDGHEPGCYGSGDAGLPPVERAPDEELQRLSREITAALDAMHAERDAHPEAAEYFASCDAYGRLMQDIEAPYLAMARRSGAEELEAATAVIGRRRTCSRDEMAAILARLRPVADQDRSPSQWADICRGITMVLVSKGCVSYSEPGSLWGGKAAVLMFVPSGVKDAPSYWADRIIRVKS